MPDVHLQGAGVSLSSATATSQWLLQCRASEVEAIRAQTGLALGSTLLASTPLDGWHALHLSPDEWLLIAGDDADQSLAERINAVDGGYSLVDVSNRSLGLRIDGANATDLLANACPLDLELLQDGACTRTLLGKATIVLWRHGEAWQISYARSFHDYVLALLKELVTDLPAA